ncbi:hypothetical protein [Kitasatospora sp. NPDC094016]|uniref:hypothetical protein n=1 Tax=Kitasatospora sp. NPDC094016 TaxID=3154986 RepID=UPI00332C6E78
MSHRPATPDDPAVTFRPSPRRTRRLRIVGLAAVATTIVAIGTVGAAHFQGAAQASTPVGSRAHRLMPADELLEHLKCSATGALTSSPGLTDTLQTTHGSLTGLLKDCESDDGSQSNIKSGSFVGSDTDTATCNGKSTWNGSMTITWYGQPHQQGAPLGTSVIDTNGNQTAQNDAAENTIVDDATGSVTLDSSLLAGQSVLGFALPTSDITSCGNATPLTGAQGIGELVCSGL